MDITTTCLWRYLFRCEALDLTFLECGDDTTFRAEVNDFWLWIPEVKPEKQILYTDYVGWVLSLIDIRGGDLPRVLGGLELPLFPDLGLERRLRFLWRSMLSVAENTKVCRSSLRGEPAFFLWPFNSGSISSSLNQMCQLR